MRMQNADNTTRPAMDAIPAAALTEGRIVWLSGHRYRCIGVRRDPIGNGTERLPAPRVLADLEWTGEGRDPGPGYRAMIAGRALDLPWTVERQATGQP